MEIDITDFFNNEDASDYSASAMELGENAGKITWNNAMREAGNREPSLLDTEEKLDAMREFALSSGGWDEEEIAAWSPQELNALFIQWISGDMRGMPTDSNGEIDWAQVETLQSAGQISSNISGGSLATDGRVYFYLGS